jgi:hypothetical protein
MPQTARESALVKDRGTFPIQKNDEREEKSMWWHQNREGN